MKIKKLVSLFLSLAVFSSYAVQASAAVQESQVDADTWLPQRVAVVDYRGYGTDTIDGLTYTDYYWSASGENRSFESFLENALPLSYASEIRLPDAQITIGSSVTSIGNTGYLPTKLYPDELDLMGRAMSRLGSDQRLVLPINDPQYLNGIVYEAQFTKSGTAGFIGTRRTLNAALNFQVRNGNLHIRLIGINNPSAGKVSYRIKYGDFDSLLASAGLLGKPMTLYNGDGSIETLLIPPHCDANFTLSADNGWSVYYGIADESEYISKSDAKEMIDKLASELNESKDTIKKLQDKIDKMDDKYLTEDEVKKLISSYYNDEDNLKKLVESIFDTHKYDEILKDKLKDILTDGTDIDVATGVIAGYVIGQVVTQLQDLNKRVDKLESLITDAIEKQLDKIFGTNVTIDSIKDLIAAAGLLESLKGQDGKDGKDGEDGKDGLDGLNGLNGENFDEWVKRNYGGMEAFIDRISFEGWVKQYYGNVDNFIKSISGSSGGLSAYELAVQQGYRGTLGQWLESLQGEDGKSAYELAVQQGYNGTLSEWLDSLHGEDGSDGEDGKDGEDGQDGRDGRDGRDGQIVYVNGTYGQVPAAGNTGVAAADDDDVYISDGTAPAVGTFAPVKGSPVNPSTGAAVGLILPAAAGLSVLLVKKGGRRRGRK